MSKDNGVTVAPNKLNIKASLDVMHIYCDTLEKCVTCRRLAQTGDEAKFECRAKLTALRKFSDAVQTDRNPTIIRELQKVYFL